MVPSRSLSPTQEGDDIPSTTTTTTTATKEEDQQKQKQRERDESKPIHDDKEGESGEEEGEDNEGGLRKKKRVVTSKILGLANPRKPRIGSDYQALIPEQTFTFKK